MAPAPGLPPHPWGLSLALSLPVLLPWVFRGPGPCTLASGELQELGDPGLVSAQRPMFSRSGQCAHCRDGNTTQKPCLSEAPIWGHPICDQVWAPLTTRYLHPNFYLLFLGLLSHSGPSHVSHHSPDLSTSPVPRPSLHPSKCQSSHLGQRMRLPHTSHLWAPITWSQVLTVLLPRPPGFHLLRGVGGLAKI